MGPVARTGDRTTVSTTAPTAPLRGLVGIPCAESSRHSLFWSHLAGLRLPPATAITVASGSSPAQNRNMIISTMLATPTIEWVMFLDDDHIIPPDTVHRLLAHNVDIVSALYLHRSPPFRPLVFASFDPSGSGGVAWREMTREDKGLVECAAVPAGGLLVRRRVFECLPRPWFRLGQIDAEEWGDDIDFCRRVGTHGDGLRFKIHCDLDLVFGHLTTMELRPYRGEGGVWLTAALRGEHALMGRTWK